MMKAVIFASLVAGAAAFAPVAQKSTSTALNMAFEDELGAQPPLGFFDRKLLLAMSNCLPHILRYCNYAIIVHSV